MRSLGSLLERLSGDVGTEARRNSATNILQRIVLKKQKVVLEIQREMVDHQMPLAKTSPGQELDKSFSKVRLTHEKQLKMIQDTMSKADAKTQLLLKHHEKHYQAELNRLDKHLETLNTSIAEMYKQQEKQLKAIVQMRKDQQRKAQELEARPKNWAEHESQNDDQKQAFGKKRSEMKTSKKAQQEQIPQHDAEKAGKLQIMEKEHNEEPQQNTTLSVVMEIGTLLIFAAVVGGAAFGVARTSRLPISSASSGKQSTVHGWRGIAITNKEKIRNEKAGLKPTSQAKVKSTYLIIKYLRTILYLPYTLAMTSSCHMGDSLPAPCALSDMLTRLYVRRPKM